MMRDKIAEILPAFQDGYIEPELIADAIIEALPGMVPDLEWQGGFIASPTPYQIWSNNGGSGAPDDPYEEFENFRVFEPYLMLSVGPKGDGSDQFLTLEEAKAAANAHHRAAIMAAMGVAA